MARPIRSSDQVIPPALARWTVGEVRLVPDLRGGFPPISFEPRRGSTPDCYLRLSATDGPDLPGPSALWRAPAILAMTGSGPRARVIWERLVRVVSETAAEFAQETRSTRSIEFWRSVTLALRGDGYHAPTLTILTILRTLETEGPSHFSWRTVQPHFISTAQLILLAAHELETRTPRPPAINMAYVLIGNRLGVSHTLLHTEIHRLESEPVHQTEAAEIKRILEGFRVHKEYLRRPAGVATALPTPPPSDEECDRFRTILKEEAARLLKLRGHSTLTDLRNRVMVRMEWQGERAFTNFIKRMRNAGRDVGDIEELLAKLRYGGKGSTRKADNTPAALAARCLAAAQEANRDPEVVGWPDRQDRVWRAMGWGNYWRLSARLIVGQPGMDEVIAIFEKWKMPESILQTFRPRRPR